MPLIEGFKPSTTFKPSTRTKPKTTSSSTSSWAAQLPKPKPRTAAIPKAASDDQATRPWVSPVTPTIAAGRIAPTTGASAPSVADPRGTPWGGAVAIGDTVTPGAEPGQMTSVTDSDAEAKRKADDDIAIKNATDKANAALETQIQAIEAEFGMTREQLLADEGEAGRQFRQALAGLTLQRDESVKASMNDMIERGILRSGLTVQKRQEIGRDFATAEAEQKGDRDYKLAQIAAQKAALDPQEAQAKAQATADHKRVLLDVETMRALSQGGVG